MYRSIIPLLLAFIVGDPVDDRGPLPDLYDARYFFIDADGMGQCSCGAARIAAANIIRKHDIAFMVGPEYRNMVPKLGNNPPALGFFVGQVLLGRISVENQLGPVYIPPLEKTFIVEDVLNALDPYFTGARMYMPSKYHHKAVDGIIVESDAQAHTARIILIQFTINKYHQNSEHAFYSSWTRWVRKFEGFALESTFVWITEDRRDEVKTAEKMIDVRGDKVVMPAHKSVFLRVKDVDAVLDDLLGRARKNAKRS